MITARYVKVKGTIHPPKLFFSSAEHKIQNSEEQTLSKTTLDTIEFNCIRKKKHCDIFHNIFFCFPQKKKSHTGLEVRVSNDDRIDTSSCVSV